MISWGDVYKVGSAMVPLYVPLLLGFWSVRWWKIFTPEQCEAVNRLVAFFAVPFFTFGFTVHTDPFHANYRAIAADVVSKVVIVAGIGAWVCFTGRGHDAAVNWSITSFSLSTLTSSLVVGVPMTQAMYGDWAQQLVVQLSVFQAIVWLTLLLFALEFRKVAIIIGTQQISSTRGQQGSRHQINDVEANVSIGVEDIAETSSTSVQLPQVNDEQANTATDTAAGVGVPVVASAARPPSIWALVKVVAYKLGRNPNPYASVGGIFVACIANRYDIIGSIYIQCTLIIEFYYHFSTRASNFRRCVNNEKILHISWGLFIESKSMSHIYYVNKQSCAKILLIGF